MDGRCLTGKLLDLARGGCRAIMADNYGHADLIRGRIDGDALTYQTIGDAPVRLLTWDRGQPPEPTWRTG